MLSTLQTYRMVTQNLDRSLQMVAQEPAVSTASSRYLSKIGNDKTIDDFVNDSERFRFAMTAFGLQDMVSAKALIKKVLTEGVSDPKAFVYKLTDQRFLAFAKAFDFHTYGDQTTQRTAVQQGAVDTYVRQQLETEQGDQNDGVRLALYFARKAPTITSPYSILADPALLTVVQTALGLPKEMSMQDIDLQAKTISSRLDLSSLSDPTKLDQFLSKFAAQYDMQQGPSLNPILSLFDTQSQPSVSVDLLVSLSSLKFGGQ